MQRWDKPSNLVDSASLTATLLLEGAVRLGLFEAQEVRWKSSGARNGLWMNLIDLVIELVIHLDTSQIVP